VRPLWKGSIGFGLVSIPVKLYVATESKDVRFRLLHRECGTPIQYLRWCPRCERELDTPDVTRGFEYRRDEFVLFEPEELENLPLPTAKTVNIVDFVELESIDPIYFDRSYFLEPDAGGAKAYSLLRRAMEESGRAAIAKVVIKAKESLAAVRVYGDGILVMETMHFADEVRSPAALDIPSREVQVDPRELDMAKTLVSTLATGFDPGRYRNDYREALQRVIEEKAAGEEIVAAERPERPKVVDIMEALKESVREAEERRRAPAGVGQGRGAR